LLRTRLAGLLLAVITLAGCSGGSTQHVPVIPVTAPPSATQVPRPVADPTEVTIPKIGVHSTLIPLGLNTDPKVGPIGAMQVPAVHTPTQAGWYARGGVQPGQPGPPLVIAGHVNGAGMNGVFYRLRELRPGDTAQVKLKDGTVLTFRVTAVGSAPKTAFPGEKVFRGASDHATAVFITCGGDFDPVKHSYRDNILVFATLAA
jgi:hypothetical protein